MTVKHEFARMAQWIWNLFCAWISCISFSSLNSGSWSNVTLIITFCLSTHKHWSEYSNYFKTCKPPSSSVKIAGNCPEAAFYTYFSDLSKHRSLVFWLHFLFSISSLSLTLSLSNSLLADDDLRREGLARRRDRGEVQDFKKESAAAGVVSGCFTSRD